MYVITRVAAPNAFEQTKYLEE